MVEYTRTIGAAGADHTTLEDYETFITTASNYATSSGDWDSTEFGRNGDQAALLFDEDFIKSAAHVFDLDGLTTATNFKVTFRPNTGVDEVGVTIDAAGAFDLPALDRTDYTPSVRASTNHSACFGFADTTSVEVHVEGLFLSNSNIQNHRATGFGFPTASTFDFYADRCLFYAAGGSIRFQNEGATTGTGTVYVRNCVIQSGYANFTLNCSGTMYLGNTFMRKTTTTDPAFEQPLSGAEPVDIYGNLFLFNDGDGPTTPVGHNITNATVTTDMNVSNVNSTAWDGDFPGTNDVNNETILNCLDATDDWLSVKSGGGTDGVVIWDDLPAAVQNAWSDTDFAGNAITQSGTFAAGAIFLAGAAGVKRLFSNQKHMGLKLINGGQIH